MDTPSGLSSRGRTPEVTEGSFGALLRGHRRAAGLTQEELAERAGLGVRTISDMERGVLHTPQKDTVALLAEALALASAEREVFEAAARRLRRLPSAGALPVSAPTAPVAQQDEQGTAVRPTVPGGAPDHLLRPAEGENRVLTVLFASLYDADQRTASLPPEDVAAVIDQGLTAMVETVHRYDGQINRLLGDGLLAFFGTPQAHENDPERAILAALELRAAVQQLGFLVTVSINAGEVYLGAIGTEQHREITAQGPVVTVAARLREVAQPGQILVGEAIYRSTRRAFAFTAQQAAMPGVQQPAPAYAVLGALLHPEKLRGIDGLRAELIGRDEDLAKLTGALAAVQDGRGQIALLIGDAGVGKSRLIAELKARAMPPVEGQPAPLWLEGRCQDIGVAASYGPFLDMLRTYFAFSPEDDDRARGEQIAAAARTLVGQGDLPPARAEDLLPVLGNLLAARFGNELDERLKAAGPEQIKHQTFLTLQDFFLTLARRRPVVLVLEDLHWADTLSLELLTLLLEALAQAPLFLVCAYRPEPEHRSWRLASVAARKCPDRSTELHLRELSSHQSRGLVESLLQGEALPPAVKEQILAKTQGNPFFVEEVLRSLIDAGLLYHDGSVWRARQEISAVAVPETVQSVILSRVDRLGRQVKHTLQSAAVVGRLFRRRLVGEVAHIAADGASSTMSVLDRALEQLEDRQLIYQERTIPEAEYSFQHALTQETVYHNILRRRRTVLHRQVAEAMERLYGESLPDYYEQLAYHYEQAGAAEKAAEYLLKAGEKARRACLYDEALDYFQRVLAHLEGSVAGAAHPEWVLSALSGLGVTARFLGKLTDAEEYFRRAIALGHALQQPARERALLYYHLGDVLFHLDRHAEIVQLSEEGMALLGDDTESLGAALLLYRLAMAHEMLGAVHQSLGFYRRAAHVTRKLPYSEYLTPLIATGVFPHLYDKDVDQARELARSVDQISQQHSADLGLAGSVQGAYSTILTAQGDLCGALTHQRRALHYAVRVDSLTGQYTSLGLMDLYIGLGELRKAAECTERVRALRPEGVFHWVAKVYAGLIALCEGSVDAATAQLEAVVRANPGTFAGWETCTMVSLGRAYLAQRRCEAAMSQFAEALTTSTAANLTFGDCLFVFVGILTPNALSGIEAATGGGEQVRTLVEQLRQEYPAAMLLPLMPCLGPAVVGSVRQPHILEDFTAPLSPAWTWLDPFGDCSCVVADELVLRAVNGRDLWHVNRSAPRLLRPAPSGDFAVQTTCGPVSAAQPTIGGLLLWQDQAHYLVLERGHWGAADIAFRGCLANADRYLGRGRLVSERVWLRLERQGSRVRALCSADGQEWFTAGEIEFAAREGEQVGLHAIGMIDRTIYHGAYPEGTAIRFDAFAVWTAETS